MDFERISVRFLPDQEIFKRFCFHPDLDTPIYNVMIELLYLPFSKIWFVISRDTWTPPRPPGSWILAPFKNEQALVSRRFCYWHLSSAPEAHPQSTAKP